MTYLNHAGTSWPKPEPVRAAVERAMGASPDDWPAQFERHHARIAQAFGAAPERLLLTPGCTSALSVAVADHAWTSGDRVLISAFEHHALHRPVTKLGELGVRVDVVPPEANGAGGPFDLDRLRAELEAGGVRMVAVTAAANVTGELLPVREICAFAREHGALALVDAAQIAGWLPIDVAELGADLLAFAGHKALQAPWGIGGLMVAPHVAMNSPAAACELPLNSTPSDEPACAALPGYCDVGSVDRLALAGLAAALDWLDEPQQTQRLARARALTAQLESALRETDCVRVHASRGADERLPTVAFTVRDRVPAELASQLAERGVTAAAGLQCAPLAHTTLGTAPAGVLRLSFGPASTEADAEHALEALSEAL